MLLVAVSESEHAQNTCDHKYNGPITSSMQLKRKTETLTECLVSGMFNGCIVDGTNDCLIM